MSSINAQVSGNLGGQPTVETDEAVQTGPAQTTPQQQQKDSIETSENEQKTLVTPESNAPHLQQPEVQQWVLSTMIMSLLAMMNNIDNQASKGSSKSSNQSAKDTTTTIGEGSISSNAQQQNFMQTHEEGLKTVSAEVLKKMLKSMPQKEVMMLLEKTKNQIISDMWEAFQKGVDENNERSKEQADQDAIVQADIDSRNLDADQLEHDRKQADSKE